MAFRSFAPKCFQRHWKSCMKVSMVSYLECFYCWSVVHFMLWKKLQRQISRWGRFRGKTKVERIHLFSSSKGGFNLNCFTFTSNINGEPFEWSWLITNWKTSVRFKICSSRCAQSLRVEYHVIWFYHPIQSHMTNGIDYCKLVKKQINATRWWPYIVPLFLFFHTLVLEDTYFNEIDKIRSNYKLLSIRIYYWC